MFERLMARSSYIYVIINNATGDFMGAFTVKHEMQTARGKIASITHVLRFRDGQLTPPIEVE